MYIYLHGDADRRICTLARLSDSVGASWKFLRASCEPARILQGTACHLLGPARSLLQPRGSSLKNPKTPSGHSYQPLALSWKLPGTQELQTHAPEILFLARKNKDFVFYMKLMYVAAMHKYARRWGQSTILRILLPRAATSCSQNHIFYKEKRWSCTRPKSRLLLASRWTPGRPEASAAEFLRFGPKAPRACSKNLISTRKIEDSMFCDIMMAQAMIQKYARRWGQRAIFGMMLWNLKK